MPGVFKRIALTEPPVEVAAIMPPIRIMAWNGSMPKVSGIMRATAVVPPSPGIAPNQRPTADPAISNRIEFKENRLSIPIISDSNTSIARVTFS